MRTNGARSPYVRACSRGAVHTQNIATQLDSDRDMIGHREIAIYLAGDASIRDDPRVLVRTRSLRILVAMWSLFQYHRTSWTTPPARTWWCGRAATWRYGARRQEHRSRRSRGVARRVARSACQTGAMVRIFVLLLLLLTLLGMPGYILSHNYYQFATSNREEWPLARFLSRSSISSPFCCYPYIALRTLNVITSQNVCNPFAERLCCEAFFLARVKTKLRKACCVISCWLNGMFIL